MPSNFGRGHYGEHSCKIVLNVAILFGRAEPIDTVLAEGIIRNISVKLYVIRASGSVDVVYRFFLSTALVAIFFGRAKTFAQFW